LRKRIIIRTQFFFDLPPQRGSSPQYPASANPSSSRYAATLVLHRIACSHLSGFAVSGIERHTARATSTVNGPAASLRRISPSRNSDGELMPIARRNSGTTPRVMVFLVKGRAISSMK
jgi:hypothetical protein